MGSNVPLPSQSPVTKTYLFQPFIDDFEVHRTVSLVNKVRPLPKGLINELLPVNTLLPPSLVKNKIPSFLCDLMQKDPDSPSRYHYPGDH